MGAVAENMPKTRKKPVRLAKRRGSYLSILWTIWAEILWDSSRILGLSCVQILLDSVEERGSSGPKRGEYCPKKLAKKGQKGLDFGVIFWGVTRLQTTF